MKPIPPAPAFPLSPQTAKHPQEHGYCTTDHKEYCNASGPESLLGPDGHPASIRW